MYQMNTTMNAAKTPEVLIFEISVRKKFDELVEAEEAPEKIKEQFNTEELKALAISLEIEPEEGDTKLDLVNAILDELKDEDDE